MIKLAIIFSVTIAAYVILMVGFTDETGKYITGFDDPSLSVTEKEIAKVREVLEKQDEQDKARGISRPAPRLSPEAVKSAVADASTSEAPAGATSGPVKIRSLYGTLPDGWTSVPPATTMRIAEFKIPASANDPEGGVVAVTYLGQSAGGIEENLNRWYGQFEQPDGKASREVAKTENLKADDMDILLLDLSGTMKPSTMPGAPATPERPNWRVLGAIVSSGEGPYFFKATGPEKTMADNRGKMVAFLTGLSNKPAQAVAAAAPAQPRPATPVQVAQAAPPAPVAQPAAPETKAAGPVAAGSSRLLKIRTLAIPLPEGWESVPPASSMREAEIKIAPEAGDPEPGVMPVFYFGPEAGSIQENVDRWIGQFTQPDGKDSKELAKIKKFKTGENGEMEVTLVELTGTMKPSNMPGAPASPERPDWRLMSAIAMTAEGPYFFKGTGPEKTMTENRDKMIQFISSMKVSTKTEAHAGASAAVMATTPTMTKATPVMAGPKPAPAAPQAAPQAAPANVGTPQPVVIKSLKGELPAGWKSVPPASSMRLADIQIPPTGADKEPGLISVFYFGEQAGTVEMNLDRWYGQFEQPDGAPSKSKATRETLKAGDMDVTLVDLTGTMQASMMPGAPQTPKRENWRLLGAIIMTPEGPYFFKGTGPNETMGANREKIIAFVQSLRMQ